MRAMSYDPNADAFRRWGYLQAALDPLGRLAPLAHPELDAVSGPEADHWRAIYCGSIGARFMHMPDPDRCRFIAERMETAAPAQEPGKVLRRLAEVELFEKFLHARYVGTKRYSLEGAAALVTLLDAVLEAGAGLGTEFALIGMSHRGRLSVMTRVVGVPPSAVFAGFGDVDPRSALGGGDVKYHLGATGLYRTGGGTSIATHLVSNPSHLEAVNPVLMGRARARQRRLGDDGAKRVLPISVHGDAAFAGQGIASETLNLAGLDGFAVGGTVHVIVNNLIGFTAEPSRLHTSRYAADTALRLPIPILHVNGEDPDAVARAARIALEYRFAFASDVVVDLIGYRRYGHSEVDDPTTTQPLLYQKIAALPMLFESYAARTGAKREELDALKAEIDAELERDLALGRKMTEKPVLRRLPAYWGPYVGGPWREDRDVATAVTEDRLEELARRLTSVPSGFAIHPKVATGLKRRLEMGLGKAPIDWGMAEALAFGSLLLAGTPVRFAGQDSRRGTFNQRHAVWIDQATGAEHLPLQHLAASQGFFEILDTPLSEAASVGFEYGFSRDYPEALVCWEAQFGDFANGAQVILDQFVSAAEDKWGLLSGLVLLLPHGYEGQGPEHSSARLERYLQLAGEDNIQICQPTTAAQYFHVLRRQVLSTWRKPLVVLTPKGMLRVGPAASDRAELAHGRFRTVIPDDEADAPRRLLVCSGRIAHELRSERERREAFDVAILTVEQLHPFPEKDLASALSAHAGAREVVWVQEEPANMGALSYVRPRLQRLTGDRALTSVKRSASASPATGSSKAHAIEQQSLLDLAFARFA
jgi:2-oxoglutarate dehydrogenase E1 component